MGCGLFSKKGSFVEHRERAVIRREVRDRPHVVSIKIAGCGLLTKKIRGNWKMMKRASGKNPGRTAPSYLEEREYAV
jgi:hypothetical protein